MSFTAFLIAYVDGAGDAGLNVHAYRRDTRLILFDDVEVNTRIEAGLAGQNIMQSLVICAANCRSVGEIPHEIRAARAGSADGEPYRAAMAFLTLPALRSLAWRVVPGNPFWFKGSDGLHTVADEGNHVALQRGERADHDFILRFPYALASECPPCPGPVTKGRNSPRLTRVGSAAARARTGRLEV